MSYYIKNFKIEDSENLVDSSKRLSVESSKDEWVVRENVSKNEIERFQSPEDAEWVVIIRGEL